MEIIKVFKITDTLNNKVNIEKLSIELKTSVISKEAYPSKFIDEIFVRFQEEITADDLLVLEAAIAAHDGGEADVTEDLVQGREFKIRELVQMAKYHPVLDDATTTAYLTDIDNYINAFIRSGDVSSLVPKIAADAADVENPFHTYLNQVVNTQGNYTFEYFIQKITE